MPEARAIFYLIDQRFIDAAGGDPSFGEKESQLQNRYNAQVNRWKEKRLAQYMEVLKR